MNGFLFLNRQPHPHLHRHAAVLVHSKGLLDVVVRGQLTAVPLPGCDAEAGVRRLRDGLQDVARLQFHRVTGSVARTSRDGVVNAVDDVPLRRQGEMSRLWSVWF